jgi:hypothetical protein
MDLQAMRDQVRDYLESDDEELPDALLDGWFAEAFTRILNRDARWPWLEKTWEFDAEIGVGPYTIGTDVAEVQSIVDTTNGALGWLGHQEAVRKFTRVPSRQGVPVWFSKWDGAHSLWPIPNAAFSYVAHGYRVPAELNSADPGSEPDLPAEYHPLLVRWAIACQYERTDDTEMAAYNRQHFEDQLGQLWSRSKSAPTASPVVMNSGGSGVRRGGVPNVTFVV